MTLRAILYDASGDDRAVDLDGGETPRFDRDRLLWIDLDDRDAGTLRSRRRPSASSARDSAGLTLLAAVALPAVVVAGVMGMNFKAPIFDDPGNFLVVIGAMIAFSLSALGLARLRHWV